MVEFLTCTVSFLFGIVVGMVGVKHALERAKAVLAEANETYESAAECLEETSNKLDRIRAIHRNIEILMHKLRALS